MKALLGAISSYLQSLTNLRMPAEHRARDPLANHPWVFAAAMAISRTAGQAPFTVFRDTRAQGSRLRGRDRKALARYTRGKTAVQRAWKRLISKDLVEVENHPIVDLLNRPNPYQLGTALMQLTFLWLAIRGECYWVLTDEEGVPVDLTTGVLPERIWPVSPDQFEPIWSNGQVGELVGWKFKLPAWMPGVRRVFVLDMDEVIHFKTPNPDEPWRGLSPITAVALGIQTDLKAKTYNESVLDNQGRPNGALSTERMLNKDEREEILTAWKERHEGVENAARLALLFGGIKWQQISLSPQDMEFLKTFEWDREEILAVIGTPPSVLGLPNRLNYATQLGQDKNFWDKTILPYDVLVETTLEATLFFHAPDDTFGMFDLSNVEAMRAGIKEKIDMADRMTGQGLHATPRIAYQVVGLEVPDYEGIDVSLVPALSIPLDAAMESDEAPSAPPVAASREPSTKATAPKRWREFVRVQSRMERRFRRAYRGWLRDEQNKTLKKFDQATAGEKHRVKVFNLNDILPLIRILAGSLRGRTKAIHLAAAKAAAEFTKGEIPTLEIDPKLLSAALARRQKVMLASIPKTLREKLRKSLAKGIEKGETFAQLRRRIVSTYAKMGNAAHATTVARTETAGIMNDVRHKEFKKAKMKTEWATAGDEMVREAHVQFGQSGSHDPGFNYLSLTGESGTLEHPGDSRGPAKQVVNCRCTTIAADE